MYDISQTLQMLTVGKYKQDWIEMDWNGFSPARKV